MSLAGIDISKFQAHSVRGAMARFYPLGDTAVQGYPKPKYPGLSVKDDGKELVKPPLDFKEVWNDKGSGGKTDVTLYRMLPQPGYICLGDVAVASYFTKPDKNAYRYPATDLYIYKWLRHAH
ncbi:uncharacterized protein LOC144766277 [Lissotriton helveticus]